MSDDLISRQAAIKLLKAKIAEIFFKETAEKNVEKWLNELPPVQSELKIGRWEHDCGHFANRWICSQCGYKLYFEKSEAKYCPNCGAKMESDNEV